MVMLANAGVPMIVVQLGIMIWALVPIVLIEAGVIRTRLGGRYGNTLLQTAVANIASTLLGVPLTWIVLLVLQFTLGGGDLPDRPGLTDVVRQIAWIGGGDKPLPQWFFPAMAIVVQCPFFAASWLTEWGVLAAFRRGADRRRLAGTVGIANAITYGLLIAFWACMMLVPMD